MTDETKQTGADKLIHRLVGENLGQREELIRLTKTNWQLQAQLEAARKTNGRLLLRIAEMEMEADNGK